jgi:hypothetical protein
MMGRRSKEMSQSTFGCKEVAERGMKKGDQELIGPRNVDNGLHVHENCEEL